MPDVKFCGLTRPMDAEYALALGAGAIGVVFAPSARRISALEARDVLGAAAGTMTLRVGVFAGSHAAAIIDAARVAQLDVAQIHGAVGPDDLTQLIDEGLRVWRVQPVAAGDPRDADIPEGAELVLLDTAVEGRATGGGTGTTFDWPGARDLVTRLRRQHRVGVAGGLRPTNVANAIHILQPDLVDVSSGVESQPGIKDHRLMEAFMVASQTPTS